MGRYDDITPDRLQSELVRFARLLLTLQDRGVLLEESPAILKLLGELRQMIFAYEVRGTKRLAPPEGEEVDEARPAGPTGEDEPAPEDSLRIVREAVERERRFLEDLGAIPDEEDDVEE